MTTSPARRSAVPPVMMLPFLDIVFATIGIFVMVFALQEIVEQTAKRQLAVDHLVTCTDGDELHLRLAPDADPLRFDRRRLAEMLDLLGREHEGIRNVTFAFGAACFELRRLFVAELGRFLSALPRDRDAGGRAAFRVSYRPLGAAPDAEAMLVARWQREVTDDR